MKKVLIIEDNENNLYLMRFILTKLGHTGHRGPGRGRRRRAGQEERGPT